MLFVDWVKLIIEDQQSQPKASTEHKNSTALEIIHDKTSKGTNTCLVVNGVVEVIVKIEADVKDKSRQ